ncbi:unnamed protein product [Schistosoma rodhaini]|uniref:hypothetical protein n=1 Tax=Schistosoma mansoni TaxID=6183 RepID=UPI0001A6278A|nr:hypothetical protein Smp_169700.1 [Schistosoma mansoni]CAH8562005.1 unnamed protein product [Schistosoma rodhaini]|eukprot:XP_018651520.1 hypothetical protein Smp_169700.1 [Schistosoma mansoni]
MHFSKVNGNEPHYKMPAKSTFPNHDVVKGSSTDVAPLEHLFVTKFSKLTIDDEYKYNLAYLVTENNGTTPVVKSSQTEKQRSVTSNTKPLNRIHVDSIQRKSEPVIHTDHRGFHRSCRYRRQKPLRGKVAARHSSPVYISSPESYEHMSSDFDDRREFDHSSFAKHLSKVHDNNGINQSHFFEHKKALVLNNAPLDTTSSKLNCCTLKCPTSLNIDSPLCELKNNLKVQKPNPNTKNIVSRRETSRTIEKTLRQANNRVESMKIEVNAPDPLMRDDFCSHDVASRVKAFKALMKSEELESIDQNSETKSIKKVTDERKIPDVPYQENHIGLRRSKTFSGEQMSRRYQKHYLQYMDLCFDCGKRIYPVDRISTGERVYHKSCFRCATCQRTLLVGNFASLDGVIFCKPHYIEQFHMSAGRYEYRQSLNQSAPLSSVFRVQGEY